MSSLFKAPAERARVLEEMIDASSLADIVQQLSDIAEEKAEHIESNWQDRITARPWHTASRKLDLLAAKTEV